MRSYGYKVWLQAKLDCDKSFRQIYILVKSMSRKKWLNLAPNPSKNHVEPLTVIFAVKMQGGASLNIPPWHISFAFKEPHLQTKGMHPGQGGANLQPEQQKEYSIKGPVVPTSQY